MRCRRVRRRTLRKGLRHSPTYPRSRNSAIDGATTRTRANRPFLETPKAEIGEALLGRKTVGAGKAQDRHRAESYARAHPDRAATNLPAPRLLAAKARNRHQPPSPARQHAESARQPVSHTGNLPPRGCQRPVNSPTSPRR